MRRPRRVELKLLAKVKSVKKAREPVGERMKLGYTPQLERSERKGNVLESLNRNPTYEPKGKKETVSLGEYMQAIRGQTTV